MFRELIEKSHWFAQLYFILNKKQLSLGEEEHDLLDQWTIWRWKEHSC